VLVASAVGVLAHKHEPVTLQSAVVVANRGAFLSAVGGALPGKFLFCKGLPNRTEEGIWLASTPSLAIGRFTAPRLPFTRQPTLADNPDDPCP
jgi:hypothetical protein